MPPGTGGPPPPPPTHNASPHPCQVVRAAKAGGHFLTIEFSAVHPSEAGLYVPGLPLDAYQGTPCKLKVSCWKPVGFGHCTPLWDGAHNC